MIQQKFDASFEFLYFVFLLLVLAGHGFCTISHFYSFRPGTDFARCQTFTRFGRARLCARCHTFTRFGRTWLFARRHTFTRFGQMQNSSSPVLCVHGIRVVLHRCFSSRPADRWALKKVRNRVLTNSAESISLKSGTRFTGSSRNAISRLARFSQGPLSQRTRANYAHLTIGTHSNLLQGAVGIRFGIAGNRIIIA